MPTSAGPDHAAAEAAAEAVAARQRRRFNLVALLRLLVFIFLALAVAAAIQDPGTVVYLVAGGCLAAFLGLALWHGAVDDARRRAEGLVRYHRRGQERQVGNWEHGQEDGSERLPAGHPYANDLDLVGQGGLYALLNTAGSAVGRATLADWLFATTAWSAGEQRREAVAALSREHSWRAELAVLAGDDRQHRGGGDDGAGLRRWLAEDRQQPWRGWLPLIWLLRILVWAVVLWFGIALSLNTAVLGLMAASVLLIPVERLAIARADVGQTDGTRRWAVATAAALERLAAAPGEAPLLSELRQRAATGAVALAALARVLDAHAKRANALRALVGAVVLIEWRNLGLLHAWADRHADALEEHLQVLGEGEALACIATYAAEQGGCWAELGDEGPVFAVEDLAHPLLPRDSRVGNDVELGDGQVLLLTGANASGKSTFIRSCCLAIVLARLGAPVPARRCRLWPMRLATVMRVADDLRGGRSRFQAEVERLKAMLDRMEDGEGPVCLALDEILGGTNSLERHHGTRAVLDHARGGHGVVLVSTHDLDLARLAEAEPERFVLAHFADRAALGEVAEGGPDMIFDYQLRPGVLQSTNALRVMQAYGLPVDPAATAADGVLEEPG